MRKIKNVIVLLLTLTILLSLSITSHGDTKQLKIGLSVDENTLTPYTYVSGPGLELVYFTYDCLFHLDKDLVPQPWLVKEFKLSEDNTTYEFILHEDVRWHDGTPCTAEDVKFTYEYVKKHSKPRFTKPVNAITSIEVIDKYTVVMKVNKPQPYFLIQSLADLPIMPKHIWEKIENPDDSTATIGTGPYKLVEVNLGQYYKFKANEDYFKGKPAVDEIIMPIIKDQTALFTALKAEQIDVTTKEVAPELQEEFSKAKGIKLLSGPGFSTTLLQFNNEKPPFNNAKFREALTYSINKDMIVNTVMLGAATSGSMGFIHPDSLYYNPKVKEYTQNLDISKKLLDELDYIDTDSNGIREINGKDISLELLVYANNPIRIRIAELIKDWFGQVGVEVKIKAMDMNTVDDLVWPGFDVSKGRNYDMSMWGWGSSMQTFPGRIVELYHSDPNIGTVNIGAYKDEKFDSLANELLNEFKPDARKQLLLQLQSVASEGCAFVPLYYPQLVFAYNEKAYDNWVFIKGIGIVNKLSLITSYEQKEESVQSAMTENVQEKEGSNSWVLGLIALAVAFFFIWSRKKR